MSVMGMTREPESNLLFACTVEGALAVMNPQIVVKNFQPALREKLIQPTLLLQLEADALVAIHRQERRALAVFGKNTIYIIDLGDLLANIAQGTSGEQDPTPFIRRKESFEFSIVGKYRVEANRFFFSDGEHSIYEFSVTREFQSDLRLACTFKSKIVTFCTEGDDFYVIQRSGNLSVISARSSVVKDIDLLPQLKKLSVIPSEFDIIRLLSCNKPFTVLVYHNELLWEFNWLTREMGAVVDAGCEIDQVAKSDGNDLILATSNGRICRLAQMQLETAIDGSNFTINCLERIDEINGEWVIAAGSAGIVDFFFNNIRIFSFASFYT